MAEIREHKKPDNIWLFDYTSLATMDDCPELMVWLSERDINIIWQGLLNIERFRSRVFTAREDTEYTIASPDQFSEFQTWVSYMKANLGGFEMCNDLLQSIVDQLTALAAKPCCSSGGGGAGGAGSTQAPPNTFDDTGDAGIASHPGVYPSYTAFKTNKCNMSSEIVIDIANNFGAISNIFPSGQTIATLATLLVGALVTPVPFDDILALAALILFQPFQATFLYETFTQIFNGSEGGLEVFYYFDQLMCTLYSSENATDAYQSFRDYFVDHVVGDRPWIDAEKSYVVSFFDTIWRIDGANQLFDGTPSHQTSANCAECEGDAWWVCSFGTVTPVSYGQVIIKAVVAGDGDYEAALGVSGLPQEWDTYLDEGAPATPVSVPESVTRFSGLEGAGESCTASSADPQWDVQDTFITGNYPEVTAIAWRSSTPFTVVVKSLSI